METNYFLKGIADKIYERLEKYSRGYGIPTKKCYLFSATLERRTYGFWDFSLETTVGRPPGIKELKIGGRVPGFEISFSENRIIFRPVLLKKRDKKTLVVKSKDTKGIIYRTLLYAQRKMKKFIVFYENEEVGKVKL